MDGTTGNVQRQGNAAETWIDWDMAGPHRAPSIGIRVARSDRRHDRYICGLHHLAWVADSRADVDRLHALFADPDGLKLEFVHTPQQHFTTLLAFRMAMSRRRGSETVLLRSRPISQPTPAPRPTAE